MLERHIMVDIETLDTGEKAAVASIGAKAFDPKTGVVLPDQFEATLSIKQQEGIRSINIDTVLWWMKQSKEAQERTFGGNRNDVNQALRMFATFCAVPWSSGATYGPKQVFIWGNGNTFDNVILRSLFKDFNVAFPCDYRNDLDHRTLKFIATNAGVALLDYDKTKVAHTALDDATFQAEQACGVFKLMGGNNA